MLEALSLVCVLVVIVAGYFFLSTKKLFRKKHEAAYFGVSNPALSQWSLLCFPVPCSKKFTFHPSPSGQSMLSKDQHSIDVSDPELPFVLRWLEPRWLIWVFWENNYRGSILHSGDFFSKGLWVHTSKGMAHNYFLIIILIQSWFVIKENTGCWWICINCHLTDSWYEMLSGLLKQITVITT